MYFQDEIISFNSPFFLYQKETLSPINWSFTVGLHTSMSIEIYTNKIGHYFITNRQCDQTIKHKHTQCDTIILPNRISRKYFFQRMVEPNLIAYDLILKKNNYVVRFRIQSMNHNVSGFEEIFDTFDINSVKFEQARNFQHINHAHRLKLDLESYKIFIKEQFSKYGIGSIQQPYFFTIHAFPVIDCISLLLKSKIGTLYGSCYVDSEEGFYLDTVESNNFHLWAEPINQILLWDCLSYNGRRIYASIHDTINTPSNLEETYCGYLNHDDVCSLWDYYVGHSLKQLKWIGLQFDEEWQSDILFIFDPSEQSLMYKIKNFLKEAGYPTFDVT